MTEFLTTLVAFVCVIFIFLTLLWFVLGDYLVYLIPAIINYIKNRKNKDDNNVV